MSKIIEQSKIITNVEHALAFSWCDDPGAGFGFPCDEHGNIDMGTLAPVAHDNVLLAFTDARVRYDGIERREDRHRQGPTVLCDCGSHVHCDSHWSNTCDRCGHEYNSSGQQLAPRSQWGAEFERQPDDDYGLYREGAGW